MSSDPVILWPPLVGADFLAFIQAENREWGPVIKAGSITVD